MRHGSEVGGERIQALRLLRRGLAASPELRRGAVLTLALALVAGGGRVITPVLVQQTIDRHVTGGPARLSAMLGLAGAGVALVLVAAWAARTTNQRLATASERALCGLRVRAFNHIHALSMAHHTEEQRGALVSRVTSDVETLGQFFRWGGLAWIINSALMLAALVAMVVYDWAPGPGRGGHRPAPGGRAPRHAAPGGGGLGRVPHPGRGVTGRHLRVDPGGGRGPRLRRPGPGAAPGDARGRGPPPGRRPRRHHHHHHRRLLLPLPAP
jgi:ABC-type multidrug transport system fused ATPase/permease subunit